MFTNPNVHVTFSINGKPFPATSENVLQIAGLLGKSRNVDGNPCFRVSAKFPGYDFSLSTSACARAGGGRPAHGREIDVYEMWTKRGLDNDHYLPGDAQAFIKDLADYLN